MGSPAAKSAPRAVVAVTRDNDSEFARARRNLEPQPSSRPVVFLGRRRIMPKGYSEIRSKRPATWAGCSELDHALLLGSLASDNRDVQDTSAHHSLLARFFYYGGSEV